MAIILEVIAFDIESCLLAETAGANRIELCANPHEGGTTPSKGMMHLARQKTNLPLFPIIRPRGGDFLYSEDEYESMKQDLLLAREIGCDGVVLGLLLPDGSIDHERTSKLVNIAYPMDVTFHRAFDRVKNPEEALETVIETGCTRILTSGLHPTALEGKATIRKLVELANERIIIMPGSGIRADNLESLYLETHAREFHSSARKTIETNMQHHSPTMHEKTTTTQLDTAEVIRMLEVIRGINN